MSNKTDAHDPSARFAGTSPPAVGRQRYLTAEQVRTLRGKSDLAGALLVLPVDLPLGMRLAGLWRKEKGSL